MTLDEAALSLFRDRRRTIASGIARAISEHSQDAHSRFIAVFDPEHSRVSGSTHRHTHLPDASDFDIGLLPVLQVPAAKDSQECQGALVCYARELRSRLISDAALLEGLPELCEVDPGEVLSELKRDFEIDEHINHSEITDLITVRFRIRTGTDRHSDRRGRPLLEISTGNYMFHRVALLYYNHLWQDQLKQLGDPQCQERALSHVCLLKLLARDRRGYGQKFGCPTARGLEQLVIWHGLAASPLHETMTTILDKGPDRLAPFLTLHGSARIAGRDEDVVLRGFDPETEGWTKFRNLAEDIVNGTVDWASHLAAHGVPISCA